MAIHWQGLTEYKSDLSDWPAEAAAEAADAIARHAERAFQTIYAGYPVITGKLRGGLQRANRSTDPMFPKWELRNVTIYARAWETGGTRIWGPLKAGKLFIPTMQRERKLLNADLVAIVNTGASRVTVT